MAGDRTDHSSPSPRTFRWSELPRALGLAGDARKLVLASLGLILTWVGSYAIRSRFETAPFTETPSTWLADPGQLLDADRISWSLGSAVRLVSEPLRLLISPFLELLRPAQYGDNKLRASLLCLWAIAVWGLFGGAIARVSVLQATGNGRVGVFGALRFALRKRGALVGAPLGPLILAAMLALPPIFVGLIANNSRLSSSTLMMFLAPIALVFSLMLAFLLVGLILAWPLMHLTVAAEGEDIFDAISRSFSYVNQRFVRYVTCLFLAWLLGTLGLILVATFASFVLILWDNLLTIFGDHPYALGRYEIFKFQTIDPGASAARPWIWLVNLVVHAWAYSYFWSAATVIYLMLRRDVDGTPWHDVYLEAHDADEFAPSVSAVEPAKKSEPIPEV